MDSLGIAEEFGELGIGAGIFAVDRKSCKLIFGFLLEMRTPIGNIGGIGVFFECFFLILMQFCENDF